MTGRRIALLVATSEHIDPTLREPRVLSGDGRRLRDLLLDPEVGGFDEVVLVANESKSGIEREAERLLRGCTPEDTVLVHMTGRGFMNHYSHLFFATVSTDVTLPYSTAVPSLVLWHLLFQSQAGVKVLLLDCAIHFPMNIDDYFGDSAYTFSATNQLTATLVRGLETGAADTDGDGQISVNDVAEYLGRELTGGWSARAGQFDVNTPIAKARGGAPVPVLIDYTEGTGKPDLATVLGLSSATEFDPRQAWRRRPENERFRAPVGIDGDGRKVELDLKMGPMDGMGPHGLVVGAAGSGKSELLRTVVLAMAATHATDAVNFVFVDCGSGGTFQGMETMPQVSATVTGLGDDQWQIRRLQDALAGEADRRQQLLRNAGSFRTFWDYERARENGADLDPLPALLIVIDEFAALLAARPAFRDLLITLGRVGGSLGIHLLLAGEEFDQDVVKALDARLTYRIGLRTATAEQSTAVIGVPDAAELPEEPGAAYLKTDKALVRFNTVPVSVPVDTSPQAASVLDVLVSAMAGQAPSAYAVWLPPMDSSYPLDMLLAPLDSVPERGLAPTNSPWIGGLQTPVGLIDKPYEQRRDQLWTDFAGPAGHGAVVGAPGAGKSALLRTLVLSMALTHTPLEAQFHCVDLGGGTLAPLGDLPHVGAVVSAADKELAQRVVRELTSLVADRERRFREQAIDSMAVFRERKRDKRVSNDQLGDVFLVVDGWKAFGQQFPELEAQVLTLFANGLAYGVHVIVSAQRWADIPPATKDLIGTRFELRLADPAETDTHAQNAADVPTDRPGAGLTRDSLHFRAGLPRIDGSMQAEDVDAGLRDALDKIRQHWHGQTPPLVRAERYVGVSRRYPIGAHATSKQPVFVDFDADPHLLVYGDSESGKTNVLRSIVRAVTQHSTDKEALFMLVDYRRSMLGFIDGSHLLAYAISPMQLDQNMPDVVTSLRKRLPGGDVTPEQLRNRSWWTGPELYLIVDDYDLLARNGETPLSPLRDLLPYGRDVGLHLILARRRVPGQPRLFDPVIEQLERLDTPAVLLGANEDESDPKVLPPPNAVLSGKSGRQPIEVTWINPDQANP
ncbi:type VII secretion protein EccCb [Kibdelosporangium phytohabitans]|uniref:type VII secretion protein EccCb n=1 Tax=Kibdelosporangium phytohabitans TaxID=860235 RepID=UPI000A72D34B|nr:type VII secretion protein EccCb [Kibdelosporangium phytohabitans]MBE1469865.1 S-DNA-T family DNA segregation ATPase FtsK/SpoIIIE [Kibdelosporangium phytohabitans]